MSSSAVALRQRVTRLLTRQVAWAGGVATAAVLLLGLGRGAAPLAVVPWALLVGQAAAALRLVLGMAANPLQPRFLRRYLDEGPPDFVLGPATPEPLGLCDTAPQAGLAHVASVFPANPGHDDLLEGGPAFDLYQSANRVVTIAQSRTTSALTILSRTADGRVLQTATMAAPPHAALIDNAVPDASNDELWAAHIARWPGLSGTTVVAAEPALFLDALALEFEAYADVGAVTGAFLALAGDARPPQLVVDSGLRQVPVRPPVSAERGVPDLSGFLAHRQPA